MRIRRTKKYKKKRQSRKIIKKSIGGNKESILIILSSDEMYPEFKPQMENLKKYIEHLSKKYSVDLAGISSKDDFSNYSDILDFKYKYVNTKRQISKLCDFISENKETLKYDWFFRTRPESEMVDFDTIDFSNLPKNAVSARAREYLGPFRGKHACSVGGEGEYIHIKECKYKDNKEKLVIDDTIVFHRTVIDKGAFAPLSPEKEADNIRQDEWLLTNMLVSRGIELNIIDIDVKFIRASRSQVRRSGPIV
jgi:hypothetical protein